MSIFWSWQLSRRACLSPNGKCNIGRYLAGLQNWLERCLSIASSRTQAAQTVDQIEAALQAGALVVLFPEGTSSGGHTVLPFKSALLEPATRQTYSLTAGLLQYELCDGDSSEEVCYWKDMTLLPHLINLCSKRSVQALVHFNPLRDASTDRKQLARQLHAEVLRMKHAPVKCVVALSNSALTRNPAVVLSFLFHNNRGAP